MTNLTETAKTVLTKRYYLKGEDWYELCNRVGDAIGNNDDEKNSFHDIIYNHDFLPNSPCLMNAGTPLGQLSACFVLPIPDSMEGIFESVKNGALIQKSGGGTGYSFSRLRPKGSIVKSTQGVASGPLSFAEVFDSATETIKQGGKRRGANMGVLRVDHPDILEFIEAKDDPLKFNNFNFSVAITDEFMEAVENDEYYELIDPFTKKPGVRYKAEYIFKQIVDHAHNNGEPGVLFIDTANKANPTPELGVFEATNPCGEQWLLPYESCNLGSINLSNFITPNKTIDFTRLRKVTKLAVKFLNQVIDVTSYPIPEIEKASKKTRKIGLGIMGLHDMLIQLEVPYDSKKGRAIAAKIMFFIKTIAKKQSNSKNAALTSIQPTGTMSMIADCSSGCEPYYAIVTKKNVMDGQSFLMVNKHFERVAREEGFYSDDLMAKVASTGTVLNHSEIPTKWQKVFKTAQDISWPDHIKMQSILQNNGVDASVSKTINLPASATKSDVWDAYIMGYKLKCKGLTVYRDGSRESQVLNAGTISSKSSIPEVPSNIKLKLPSVLNAKRYKLMDPELKAAIYAIVCFDDHELPVEVFAKFPYDNQADCKEKSTSWTTICRLISLSLRYHIPIEEIVKQLERSSGRIHDLPAQLSKLLKTFMSSTSKGLTPSTCPECSKGQLIFAEGCETCNNCGYSKCS